MSTNTVDRTDSEVINGLEGKRLLSALTTFFAAAIKFTPKVHEAKTLSAAHAHVLNKILIRLLAFYKNVTNILLIERNEIFTHTLASVFSKTAEPEFQSAWGG